MTQPPVLKLGISRCLLGENVRYDGGHKLDRYLRDTLGRYAHWAPVCPEVECGLAVPREAMHLVGAPRKLRLVTVRSGVDHTKRMRAWISDVTPRLKNEQLSGFVFKARSPSCATRDARVCHASGLSTRGAGIFAAEFLRRFPIVPVEDEYRLSDEALRDNFVERVFTYSRWQEFTKQGDSRGGLVSFHTRHKLALMAHSPAHYRELGRLTAGASGLGRAELMARYGRLMMDGMSLPATVKKNTNVLYHAAGYFKKHLSPEDKKELSDVISSYHEGLVPLVVPVALLRHYTRKYREPYLSQQFYLNPHPAELKLRNHA